jgi:hypothetical protein
MSAAGSSHVKFSKNGKFLENKVSVQVEVSAQEAPVALAIAINQQFPTGTVSVGSLKADVSGDSGRVRFGDGLRRWPDLAQR